MVQSIRTNRSARFGPFEFHPESGELYCEGVKVRLQEQPARILGMLLQSGGRVVTREELREALWPADTFVDFDHSLNTAIRKLRTALEDSADEPRWVETVVRHGYRFVAAVEWAPEEVSAEETTTRSRLRPWGIGAVALSILTIVLMVQWERHPAGTARSVRTIAVLPFVNADPGSEYLSDGLAEALIRNLSASPMLRVTAPGSSLSYKGQKVDVRTAGRELGVEFVVTGEFEKIDGDYLLRAELVATDDGAQIWGNDYRQPSDRLVLLQQAFLADLSYRLGVTQADMSNAWRESPAWDLYLRGRSHWNLRTREDHLRAIAYFEQAIELDPEFALAWAGLGSAYGTLVGNQLVPGSEVETQQKSIAAIDKALSLDPTLSEAWASQAARKQSWGRDFEGAERDFLRAIELNPSYSTAHQWYSSLLWSTGRMDESRREIDLAWQIDPFSVSVVSFRCWNRMMARRYDEAIEVEQLFYRARSRPPGGCTMWCLLLKGDYAAAIDLVSESGARAGDSSRGERLRDAYARGGPEEFWRCWVATRQRNTVYTLAVDRAMAGQVDEAFDFLERAVATRDAHVTWIYADPRLDNLRSDPRFDELARRIGFPQVVRVDAR